METLLNRYRNITVLLLAIFAQLVLLAYQVKSAEDVPMIRVWAVSAVTPLAKVLEVIRTGTVGFVEGYITLHDTRQENLRMKQELGKLKMENQFLKSELSTADRAKALVAFQAQTQSKTLAARIIGMGAGVNSKVVFVDRGSESGVQKGMAVVTPDGIVGKVLASYPTGSSQVLLITDPNFAAGVISQKHQARGTLKGQGYADCKVEYVQNEEQLDAGEWFYTSGDDRIFPKGFPVGVTRVVRSGQGMKDVYVEPSGLQHGLEEVLILLEGVHQAIPQAPLASNEPVYMAPPPPAERPANPAGVQDELNKTGLATDADRLRERYKQIGAAQNHVYGEGAMGTKPPDFNLKPPAAGSQPAPAAQPAAGTPTSPAPARREAPHPATQAPTTAPVAKPAAPVTTVPRTEPAPVPRKTPAPNPAPTAQPDAGTPTSPVPAKPEAARPATQSPAPAPAAKPGAPATTVPRTEPAPAQKKTPAPNPPPAEPKSTKPIDPFL
jgi:rod shape-determining protein MreC